MSESVVDSILAARYYRAGENSFDDVCRRVANALGDNPEEKEEYYQAMMSLSFLPNSPTLMNAGTTLGQLSACFTLPVNDSLPEIFDAIRWGAIIHQSGGGTGYNFSHLRPEGSPVRSTDGVASGPVSFMRVFNAATDVIKQGGRRRGANMGILNVWHKDIMQFINCKAKEGDFSNFNISIMVSDEFMQKVADGKFSDVWVTDNAGKSVTVKEIWDGIVEGVWRNGEPGILFYDTINRKNPTPDLGEIDTTNPCGEQPLLPFESCVLGSINLAKFIRAGANDIDYPALDKMVRMAIRFLDSVITKNVFPIPQIQENTNRTRKVGLGLMGVHDAMLMLRIPYDSDAGRNFCMEVMKRINDVAVEESIKLGTEKGTFPAYKGSVWDKQGIIMRNAALTTIAPTGTISLLAGCSSGIEPVFSYAYTRRNTVGKTFVLVHPYFEAELVRVIADMGYSGQVAETKKQEVINHVHETGTVQDIAWLPQSFKSVFKTALDIGWRDHVLMQAAFQKYVHASISKTINMPFSATKDDVASAILLAWHEGIKGMTLYRTGSREDVVLALEKSKEEEKKQAAAVAMPMVESADKHAAPTVLTPITFNRPREMSGRTFLAQSGCCRLYITVNTTPDGKPMEVFIRTVGAGCEANSNALGRSISTGLQNGVPYEKFVKQFAKVHCISAIKNKNAEGVSCADVVGKCIELAATNQQIATLDNWSVGPAPANEEKKVGRPCPECGQPLDFGEGCNMGICKHCGWSGCS
ncbi:MAG TPA: adenosylcobalamin-dependent ribonucleoside-diphosphate reductase [Methanocorpusculum sp.]|nr:adenosylcobalamin-dependent ribonucleoside-diphosphate reductase [Methanocorpusculum sp.]HJJ40438.1 adenosylcobalamin-dependent ribonucleoside-diphosphate reductase [Methanocorpusculum sp.]HJJ56894.1 adenosylcobalamin-dependent ribonucleoside-diphosphate reductase [Methanocorpusculum sp.]